MLVRILEQVEKVVWRVLQAVERAESILAEPLHPEDVLGEMEGQGDGFTGTEAGPEQAE